MEKVEDALRIGIEYESLSHSLDILNAIAYRFSDRAVSAMSQFIETIEERCIKHSHVQDGFEEYLARYETAQALIVKAIETLGQLRYFETQRIAATLLQLTGHSSDRVRSKATQCLSTVAEFDLDAFYGPDRHGGIGAKPQQEIMDLLENYGDENLVANREAVLTVLDCILSPTIQGTAWSAKSVTFSRSAIPALPTVSDIRNRALALLYRMYDFADTTADKLRVVNALNAATRSERSSLDDEVDEMIARNSIDVLEFYTRKVGTDDFQIVQKIENSGYWIFFHAHRDDVRSAALRVEKAIGERKEYDIYKTLIGFEGIFGSWESLKSQSDARWELAEKERRERAAEFAGDITPETFLAWRERILEFSKTESDDLATFPVFYHFLEEFAVKSPHLAINLVRGDASKIARFLIPLLHGLWDGPYQDAVRDLIETWIEDARRGEDHHLFASTKLFLSADTLDLVLLERLLHKAAEIFDIATVRQVATVALARYRNAGTNADFLRNLFLGAIRTLSLNSNSSWVYEAWFRREATQILADLTPEELDDVLANLKLLPKIDYHAEEVLAVIARRSPEKVIAFLSERVDMGRDRENRPDGVEFEAIPFEFHKLQEPLSRVPEFAVNLIFEQFRSDSTLFAFRGARLLRNIFPVVSKEFESQLLELIRNGQEESYQFVLGILRNYRGEPFIHRLCKEIVKSISTDSPLRNEVAIALEATGVVSGEFGMAEAYERKRQEIMDWLSDPDERVQSFARWYISTLEKMRDAERKRAEEDIALRKFRYGEED